MNKKIKNDDDPKNNIAQIIESSLLSIASSFPIASSVATGSARACTREN
jgi:hypothetical protein